MIPRVHLFELEDQPWFPAVIRDLATDYLRGFEERFELHRLAAPVLEHALREVGATRVVDLCSGGGGPVLQLQREFSDSGLSVHFTLTDRFPNLDAFERARDAADGAIDFVRTPVDARAVPDHLRGFRTLFNAFHHFAPEDARGILNDASAAQEAIGVFEIPERSLRMFLGAALQPLLVWLVTPTIRPFQWKRLFWTYLVPAVPLTCLWDGMVSMLRAYTVEELRGLADGVSGSGYEWRAGEHRVRSVPGKLTYLIGRPVGDSSSALRDS